MEKLVKINEIKIPFYVRTELHSDRVVFFEDLLTSIDAEKVPLIDVTEDLRLIDGRNRLEALRNIDNGTNGQIKVNVVKGTKNLDKPQLICMAINKNLGGSQAMTTKDFVKTFRELVLLNKSITASKLSASLDLPLSMVQKYIHLAKTEIFNQKQYLAVMDVKNAGLTVEEAAKKHGISENAVQEKLVPSDKLKIDGTAYFLTRLTTLEKSYAQHVKAQMLKIQEWYLNGFKTDKDIEHVIEHLSKLTQRIIHNTNNWNSRFMQMMNAHGQKKQE